MTRALVTQLLNALEHHQSQTRPIHNTEFAIAEAREYLATEPSGERAELIAKLRTGWTVMEESEFERLDDLCWKAADMLGADAQPKSFIRERVQLEQESCELRRLKQAQQAKPLYDQQALELCNTCGWKGIFPGEPCLVCAQQAKKVPMTGDEIEKIADGCRAGAGSVWPHAFARAIEAHRDTPPAQKPTDWSAA